MFFGDAYTWSELPTIKKCAYIRGGVGGGVRLFLAGEGGGGTFGILMYIRNTIKRKKGQKMEIRGWEYFLEMQKIISGCILISLSTLNYRTSSNGPPLLAYLTFC